MPEEIRTPEPSTEMSFSDKFVGILSSPGEVYQSIVGTEPITKNWVLPLVLTIIMGIIFSFVIYSQPAIQDEMKEIERQVMAKLLESGKITQEIYDKSIEESSSNIFKNSISAVFMPFISLIWYSFLYWIVGKILFKSELSFSKVLEVKGLSFFVVCVTSLLSMVLIVSFGSIHAQPSLSQLLQIKFDPFSSFQIILSEVTIFKIWELSILGIGLSKIWGKPTIMAVTVSILGWLVWTSLLALLIHLFKSIIGMG